MITKLSTNAYDLPLQGLEMIYCGTLTSKYEYPRQTKATWCKMYGILVWVLFFFILMPVGTKFNIISDSSLPL